MADIPIDSGFRPVFWVIFSLVVGMTVIGLRFEGRRWWCQSADLSPWSSGIHSPHTSQHFVDPYSFTHFLHGLLFYALLRFVAPRCRWDLRFLLAISLECLWEILENSPMVIRRYRQSTIALGYEGDSVLNSLGDIASCGLGFFAARRLPVKWSIALFCLIELVLLILYRDNLTLNVIMLVYPFEAVKSWQLGH